MSKRKRILQQNNRAIFVLGIDEWAAWVAEKIGPNRLPVGWQVHRG